MKTIKEITEEDCVKCYVSDHFTPTKNSSERLIINQFGKNFIDTNGELWKYAIPCEELDKPEQPKWSDKYPKEWSIDAKIFKAINEGAVLIDKIGGSLFNGWSTSMHHKGYKICTSYTGTESDVWEDIW